MKSIQETYDSLLKAEELLKYAVNTTRKHSAPYAKLTTTQSTYVKSSTCHRPTITSAGPTAS